MNSDSAEVRPVSVQAADTLDAIPLAQQIDTSRLGPVSREERFITLDVLRGAAVLGILLMNIFSFSRPMARTFDFEWVTETPFDSLAQSFVCFFASEKFITLFSILFGMGLALQYGRARARRRPFVGMYSRRLLVLIAFGVLHGTLLWYGDILHVYGAIGFIALLLRGLRPRTLIAMSLFLLVVLILLKGGILLATPHVWERNLNAEKSQARMVEEQCADCDFEGNPPALYYWGDDPEARWEWEFRRDCYMWDEDRVYQSGTWWEVTVYRTFAFKYLLTYWGQVFYVIRCLSMFLLGMAMVKLGLFQDQVRSRPLYADMVLYGLTAGIPLSLVATWLAAWNEPDAVSHVAFFMCRHVGSLGMSLAYAGGLALLCLRVPWRQWLRPLAAVGQMGLSNYLGQSIVCGFIFYGYGFGLFNRVGAVVALLIALGVFIMQLVFSSVWLRYFRFGPFEWLWRTLTYLKLQPMRRRPATAAVVVADGGSEENPGHPLTR